MSGFTEGKKKSRRAKFFADGILLTAVGIGMRTVGLFSGAFITRTVGAEGVGLFTLVMTVYGFAVTFATSGISLTLTRLTAEAIGERREERLPGILSGGILYALAFSLTATAALLFGADFLARDILGDPRCALCIRILAPSLPPLALISVFSGYFIGVRRVARNASTQILSQLFKVGLTVFCLLRAGKGDVASSAALLSLVSTLTELLTFLIILVQYLADRAKFRKKEKASPPQVLPVAKIALPLALSTYVRQALVTLEHILIPRRLRLHGESQQEALSAYGVLHGMALGVVLYPMATLTSFSGLLVPEFAESFAEGDKKRLSRLAAEAFETTLGYAVCVAVFLAFFSEEIGYAVYRSADAGLYIAVLAPAVPIMYLDHVTDNMLKGIGEQVYSMWVNVTDAALSILLVLILLPKFGIFGYALVIIGMEGYNFFLSLLRLRRRISFRVRFLHAILLPAAAAGLAVFLESRLFLHVGAETSPFWLILRILFAACVLAACLAAAQLFRALPKKKKAATGGAETKEKIG